MLTFKGMSIVQEPDAHASLWIYDVLGQVITKMEVFHLCISYKKDPPVQVSYGGLSSIWVWETPL